MRVYHRTNHHMVRVYEYDGGPEMWLFALEHQNRDVFRGAVVSQIERWGLPRPASFGPIRHGWMLTTDAGDALCGIDFVVNFTDDPIAEGATTFGMIPAENAEDEIEPAQIIDGPYPATYMTPIVILRKREAAKVPSDHDDTGMRAD